MLIHHSFRTVPARVQPLASEMFKVVGTTFNLSCNIYGHSQMLVVTWLIKENEQWENLYQTCIYSRENPCISEFDNKPQKFKPYIQVGLRSRID